jgi:hypothetical protein
LIASRIMLIKGNCEMLGPLTAASIPFPFGVAASLTVEWTEQNRWVEKSRALPRTRPRLN